MWTVTSIQVGLPQTRTKNGKTWQTGIFKTPVSGTVAVHPLGLEGDGVGDTKNHGGPDKAVCCHPQAHYTFWNAYFQWELPPGAFGENLTLAGLQEADLCVGDVLAIGTAQFQVSQPRIPCWKQSDKLGVRGFEKLTTQTSKTGFYLRVLASGEIDTGQPIQLVERPYPQASLVRLNRALVELNNSDLAQEFMHLPPLATTWQERFAARLA